MKLQHIVFSSVAGVIYIVGFIIFGRMTWCYFGPDQASKLGDMFGAFNSLFSGAAFLGVVVAIFLQREQIRIQTEDLRLQRHELELQRGEITLNREELARTATAQEESRQALQAQVVQMHMTARITLCHELLPIFEQLQYVSINQPHPDLLAQENYAQKAKKCRMELESIFDQLMKEPEPNK